MADQTLPVVASRFPPTPVNLGLVVLLVALLLMNGCGESQPDIPKLVDGRVNNVWMQPGQFVDAATFFSGGGHYYNDPDDPEATPLDEAHIIPLLTRLREDFQLEQYVILDETPNVAYAVVMRLPQTSERQRELETWLNDRDAEFPGMILQEWGHEWLSLDFLDKEEAQLAREAWGEE